jgi:hypothetical protein
MRMTILPVLGQLNWAAYHRNRAIKFRRAGNSDDAYIEKRKAEGSVWWSRNERKDFQTRMEFRKELAEANS